MSAAGIVWLRRDLRIRDHPALRAALDRHERVVPLFCFDRRLLGGRHASGPRTQFLLECLADLDDQLRRRGSKQNSGTTRSWRSSAARSAGWSRIRRSRRSQTIPAALNPPLRLGCGRIVGTPSAYRLSR